MNVDAVHRAGHQALIRILEEAHDRSPAELPGVVARAAGGMGAREIVLYLSDYSQRHLVALPPAGDPERDLLDIDATMAGRAYRTIAPVEAAGDDAVRLWLPLLDGTDRVGVMELAFDVLDDELRAAAQHLASLVAELVVTKDQYADTYTVARRRRDMSLAAEMQWELLPPITFATRQLSISGILEPSYEIAGDSFDYAVNGQTAHVAIVDAMGHGFAATMMATVAIGAYRHSRRQGRGMAETYSWIDRVVGAHFGMDQFVTLQLVELDGDTGQMRWLNAGHPAPLLARKGKSLGQLACSPTLPVGIGGAVAEIATESLEPGDQLLFFTDGVVEARSAAGEFFGEERLADLLVRAIAAEVPPSETVRRLAHAIMAHQEGDLQDDATLLLLTWHGRER